MNKTEKAVIALLSAQLELMIADAEARKGSTPDLKGRIASAKQVAERFGQPGATKPPRKKKAKHG
jgi:hypothetical protein